MDEQIELLARAIAAAEWRRDARLRRPERGALDSGERYAERSWGLWTDHATAAHSVMAGKVAELEAGHREALNLAKALHRRWYSHVTHWQPLDTVAGIISQIDNMTAGLGERLDAAEIERAALAPHPKGME